MNHSWDSVTIKLPSFDDSKVPKVCRSGSRYSSGPGNVPTVMCVLLLAPGKSFYRKWLPAKRFAKFRDTIDTVRTSGINDRGSSSVIGRQMICCCNSWRRSKFLSHFIFDSRFSASIYQHESTSAYSTVLCATAIQSDGKSVNYTPLRRLQNTQSCGA